MKFLTTFLVLLKVLYCRYSFFFQIDLGRHSDEGSNRSVFNLMTLGLRFFEFFLVQATPQSVSEVSL